MKVDFIFIICSIYRHSKRFIKFIKTLDNYLQKIIDKENNKLKLLLLKILNITYKILRFIITTMHDLSGTNY